jgi:hypothetical protein
MPGYYHHDIARWEGEGGSHGELIPTPHPIRHTSFSEQEPPKDCLHNSFGARTITQARRGEPEGRVVYWKRN